MSSASSSSCCSPAPAWPCSPRSGSCSRCCSRRVRFFEKVSPLDFLFGTQWSPQTAIRADQVGSSGAFGIVPLVTGTLLITAIAMLVAGPIGLFAAIYMAEYATPRFRTIAKPILEILAGIPTVVLGFFAALSLAPWIRGLGRIGRAQCRLGERARRRPGDGHDDHPVRLLAVRRRHQRRAAVAARRLLRHGRHQVGDHQEGGAAGGVRRASSRPSCWRSAAPSARP